MALTLALLVLFMTPAMAAKKYSTLEFGSRGSDVLKLQKALLSLGFDPNGTDGKFGRGTENAVKDYQKSRGLKADGKAGNQTLTKLYDELDGSSGTASGGTGSTFNLRDQIRILFSQYFEIHGYTSCSCTGLYRI